MGHFSTLENSWSYSKIGLLVQWTFLYLTPKKEEEKCKKTL
jgi:hypothetical protein